MITIAPPRNTDDFISCRFYDTHSVTKDLSIKRKHDHWPGVFYFIFLCFFFFTIRHSMVYYAKLTID